MRLFPAFVHKKQPKEIVQNMLPSVIITSGILVAFCKGSALPVVGLVGDTVHLPCEYDVETHEISDVCWGREESWFSCKHTLISTDGLTVNFRESGRYSLPRNLRKGNVSLIIKKAQKTDTGFYTCRVEIPGLFNDISCTVYLIITELELHNFITETTEYPTAEERQTQDVTDDPRLGSVVSPVHSEIRIETFILTTLRVGAIIFIPALLTVFIWKLRRSRDSNGNENISRPNPSSTVSHPNMPVETPYVEAYEL